MFETQEALTARCQIDQLLPFLRWLYEKDGACVVNVNMEGLTSRCRYLARSRGLINNGPSVYIIFHGHYKVWRSIGILYDLEFTIENLINIG